TLEKFRVFLDGEKPDPYENNKYIKKAAELFAKERSEDNLYRMFDALLGRMMEDGEAPAAMVDVNNVFGSVDIMGLSKNDTVTIEPQVRLRIDTVHRGDGVKWIPLYTDMEELNKQPTTNISMNVPIYNILKNGLEDDVEGIVINPFGLALSMPKNILKIVVAKYEEIKEGKEDV
ncbi:MAG: SseB family protein, partial [Lachnospiraceae bacterium]|nr:SseB family protein [Lachnospiraceae bacterium]